MGYRKGIIYFKGYTFGSSYPIGQDSMEQILSLFNRWPGVSPSPLGGRRSMISAHFPETGQIVIKSYARGGLTGKFNKKWYLKLGMSRSQREFEFMARAKAAGVNTPDPVAYIFKGFPFYRAWLITKKIENSKTFSTLAMENITRAKKIMPLICRNIQLLIHNRIHHIDLHPGNIIVDKQDCPFIVDFDKACIFSGNQKKLAGLYDKRWSRAIANHGFPKLMLNIW